MTKTLTADKVKADRDEFTRRFNAQPSGGGFVKFNADGRECLNYDLEKVRLRTQSGGTVTVLTKNVSNKILKAAAEGKSSIVFTTLTPEMSEVWECESKEKDEVRRWAVAFSDIVSITPVVYNLHYNTIEKMKFNK